ncbi:MAG: exonuclease domain-containing protein [Propionicimonas sp.]|nr:exonuclease domain-containing protein [Propionicimonas sp.]
MTTSPTPAGSGPAPAECWVSVDIEAAGPNPGSYSLLSIGACLYDDPAVGFSIELKPVGPAAVDSAMAVSGLSLADLAERGSEPAAAMAAFEAWLAEVSGPERRPLFVGFNAGFDWMFVCDYFHRYLGRNPFGHAAVDIKSVALGALGLAWPQTSIRRLGATLGKTTELSHNALQDARDQADLLRAILQHQNVGA